MDEEAKKHTYAPKDTPVIALPRKDDFHGLGHARALGLHATLGMHGQETQSGQGPRLAGVFNYQPLDPMLLIFGS